MNILIITYFSYKDGLTQAYTLPYIYQLKKLLPKESKLHFTTLEQEHILLSKEEKGEIRKDLGIENITVSFFRWRGSGVLAAFSWMSNLFHLWVKVIFGSYDIIHAWNTPSGVFGYLLSLFTGKRLVIDSYEPHAEPMVEAGVWNREKLRFKILFFFEKLQSKKAAVVIACVEKMKEYAFSKYDVIFDHFLWKPACVDFEKFDYHKYNINAERKKLGFRSDEMICIYAGKIGGSYLGLEIFDFLKIAYLKWGTRFKAILLGKYEYGLIKTYLSEIDLDPSLLKIYFVEHDQVPKYMAIADFALTPFVPVPSKRYGSPIKTGEYMAMGLPQIISKEISDDSDLIENENIGFVLNEWNSIEYKKSLSHIENFLIESKKNQIKDGIRKVAMKYKSFEISEYVYSKYIKIISD